jgi:hypothetical protein
MNLMKPEQIIEVVQAFKDGEKIQWIHISQYREDSNIGWCDANLPDWNFTEYLFRIKPIPKEYWIVTWPDGSQRVYGCEQVLTSGKTQIKVVEDLEWKAKNPVFPKCEFIDCKNEATHTWSGHPTCDDHGVPGRFKIR